jgi:hypothetical protein
MEVLKDAGLGTVATVGRSTAATVSNGGGGGSSTSADDTDGPWVNIATASTLNKVSVVNDLTAVVRTDWNPEMYARIKTGATITLVRYWVGFFSADPSASATPAVHYAAFRFDTSASDANWQFCTATGTATQTCTNTTIAVTASTAYSLWVTCTSTTCLGYVDGVLRATNTTNLPTSTQTMGYNASMTTLSAAARSILFGRFTILAK